VFTVAAARRGTGNVMDVVTTTFSL